MHGGTKRVICALYRPAAASPGDGRAAPPCISRYNPCTVLRSRHLLAAALPVVLVGCTWLVHFVDAPVDPCEAGQCLDVLSPPDSTFSDTGPVVVDAPLDVGDTGACTGLGDGAVCGRNDPCHDVPTCDNGVCTPHPKADDTPCAAAADACHSIPVCKTGVCGPSTPLPEGFNFKPGDDNARCCGGRPIETTTNVDCGVCGVACNTAKGQSCGAIAQHYLCLNCNGTNADCWSGCCSLTGVSHCAPSDCATGNCNTAVCPNQSHCQSDVVNYCSY